MYTLRCMHVCICLSKLNSYERMKGRMNVWKYVCNIEDVKRGAELSFFIDQILVSDRTDIHTYRQTDGISRNARNILMPSVCMFVCMNVYPI